MELYGCQSCCRFLLRRPRVPAGARGFGYHGPVFAVLVVLVAVSAAELVVVDLLVRRWPGVRIALLVLGVWGLVFMLGMVFGMLTRPHAVGRKGLRIRSGAETEIRVPWADVDSVVRRVRRAQREDPRVEVDADGRATLHLRVQDEANLELHLAAPLTVQVPQGPETVSAITFYADDTRAFLDEVRVHLG